MSSPGPASTDDIARRIAAETGPGRGPAPVHLWNPPFCGDLDIRIGRDGLWWYLGTPIGRPQLVRLFASVLRRDEDDKYYLVTPVEKIGIRVDDAPFVGMDFRVEESADGGATLIFTDNVGEETAVGPERPLWVRRDPETGEPTPYYRVRGRLDARIDRKSYFRLVDIGVFVGDGADLRFGVSSGGQFFTLADGAEAAEMRDALGEAAGREAR